MTTKLVPVPVDVTEDGTNIEVRPGDAANKAVRVNVVAGAVSATTSATATAAAPTYVEGTQNPLSVDLSGNIRTAAVAAPAADNTASGTLGALNATVQVALTGDQGCSVTYDAGGTLIGTSVWELSFDGGVSWNATVAIDPFTSVSVASPLVNGSGNPAISYPLVVQGGASHARVRVSGYTSGSATVSLRATGARTSFQPYGYTAIASGGPPWSGGGQTAVVKSTPPNTSDPGLVVLISPNSSFAVAPAASTTSASASGLGSATALNTSITASSVLNSGTVFVGITVTGSITGGAVTFEAQDSFSNWYPVEGYRMNTAGGTVFADSTYLLTGGSQLWQRSVSGAKAFRVRLSTVMTGTGSISISIVQQQLAPYAPPPIIPTSLTANIGSSGALALDATLTGGTAKSIVRGGAKGSTTAADVTGTAAGANHQGLDVVINDANGRQIQTDTASSLVVVLKQGGNFASIATPDAASGSVAGLASLPAKYNLTLPTHTDDAVNYVQVDQKGRLLVTGEAGMTALKVDGSAVTQPVSIAAAVDVSDRAARLAGKVRQTDGTLDLTLLNSAPGSDTGQVAVPVRVVSQLGAGAGGGTSDPAATAAASESATTRSAVTAALRLLDTSQGAGSQLVTAKGDQTTGLWVNLKNASVAVTGTFFQATQPVSGTITANQGGAPWAENITQFGGSAVVTGTGVSGVGIPRVTVSNDSAIKVWDGTNVAGVEPVPSGGFGNPALRVFVNSIRKATYYANAVNISSSALTANTAKAIFSFEHALASTKTVRIRKITVSGLATVAGGAVVTFNEIFLTKGTAASTGGSAVTPSKLNEAQGAAEVSCKTLPTITAATAGPRFTVLTSPAAGTTIGTVVPRTVVYDWSEAGSTEPLTLRAGVLESIVINAISQSTPTFQLSIEVEFTEE